jgi:hypothetical protein
VKTLQSIILKLPPCMAQIPEQQADSDQQARRLQALAAMTKSGVLAQIGAPFNQTVADLRLPEVAA